jgi:serine phosphatase RsbU (regulator of sigma subunit)
MCVAQIRHIDDGPGAVSLTLATGGHPPPYLVRADGSITRAELKGTPLGLLADIQIGEYTATMGPADSLVMYTDGLSERPNGEPAHTRDMEALLKGAHEKSVEELLLQVEEEIEPGSLLDDAALLVFRVAG